MIGSIRNYLSKRRTAQQDIPAAEAYDLWAATYDQQPGNLMLYLDEIIVSSLISKMQLKDKDIADIGCGTGRHWPALYKQEPASITGFDVSRGMLSRLKEKFPAANTRLVSGNIIPTDGIAFDCIISTLTIAHIEDLAAAITSWGALLKPGGDLLITDFHPSILAQGGKRSFRHHSRTLSVKNYVHPVGVIADHLQRNNMELVEKKERLIDESVKPFYEAQESIHVYNRYKGMPVIYGLLAKKNAAL